MFDGMETDARRICEVNPYISDFGSKLVSSYTRTTTSIPFCQTINSSYDFIYFPSGQWLTPRPLDKLELHLNILLCGVFVRQVEKFFLGEVKHIRNDIAWERCNRNI